MNPTRPLPSQLLLVAASLWTLAATASLALARRPIPLQANQEHYDRLAKRLLHQHRIDIPFDQSVLYPGFVAAVYATAGEDPLPVRLVQALLTGLLVCLVGLLGMRLLGPWQGAFGALLTAIPPILPVVGSQMVPTIPGLVLLVGGLLSLERSGREQTKRRRLVWAMLAGLLAGLSAAFQSFLIAAALLLGLTLTLLRTRRSQGLAFLLGLALVPLSVGTFTRARAGRFVALSENRGLNLFLGWNPSADGTNPFFDPMQRTLRRRLAKQNGPAHQDEALAKEAGHFVTHCPVRSGKLLGKKFALFLDRAEPGNNERPALTASLSPMTRHLPGFWFVMALGIAGLVWRRPGGLAAMVCSSLIFGALAVTLIFFANARFRLQALPGFALLGSSLWDWPARLKSRRRLAFLAAFAALTMSTLSFGCQALLGPIPPSGLLVNEAVVSLQQGKRNRASKLLQQALASRPDDVLGRLYLARLAKQDGRLCQALFQASAAVLADPTSSAARKALARLGREAGLPETRIAWFGAAATRQHETRYARFSVGCRKPSLQLGPSRRLARECALRRHKDEKANTTQTYDSQTQSIMSGTKGGFEP